MYWIPHKVFSTNNEDIGAHSSYIVFVWQMQEMKQKYRLKIYNIRLDR